jgi:two-component system chemotaxis sensor kinase CheA
MTTRMQPISGAWAKLPRLVRDLAHDLGKRIDLVMAGQETELDRQVLELIKDPLTHMIRNAADHGLEGPTERRAAGKSETGRISLQARHEGGAIVIEVADDGRGLSAEKIRAKAIAAGLLTAAQGEQVSDADVRQLIFLPGFRRPLRLRMCPVAASAWMSFGPTSRRLAAPSRSPPLREAAPASSSGSP